MAATVFMLNGQPVHVVRTVRLSWSCGAYRRAGTLAVVRIGDAELLAELAALRPAVTFANLGWCATWQPRRGSLQADQQAHAVAHAVAR
jgi:hypothetical protein